VYDRIIPDEERHFSTLAARQLGIAIRHVPSDDYGLFENYASSRSIFPSLPMRLSQPRTAISTPLPQAIHG
jgi:hypothetical protein